MTSSKNSVFPLSEKGNGNVCKIKNLIKTAMSSIILIAINISLFRAFKPFLVNSFPNEFFFLFNAAYNPSRSPLTSPCKKPLRWIRIQRIWWLILWLMLTYVDRYRSTWNRDLASIKDREISCHCISCKEKENIGKVWMLFTLLLIWLIDACVLC